LWRAGFKDQALAKSLATLDGLAKPHADAFIQPGFYLFQLDRFDEAADVLMRGGAAFPNHPMIALSLGSAYNRARRHQEAIPWLEHFLALGHVDASAFDALASSHADTGNLIKAKLFGTMALAEKDKATADRRGTPKLKKVRPGKKAQVIAFTLFGSSPRYLRGALQNVLAARQLYPGWTCRFYVDDSVDATFLKVLAEEGAEVVRDESGIRDLRHLLTRRFHVADDPNIGRFMVRDCDSVVNPREAAAVAEWIASGLPFHVMRDWWTHTDPMLAGLWGGFARAFPDLTACLRSFIGDKPMSTNWDQYFLRDQVWPAIRDQVMVHDRCYPSHRARPFPTPTPGGREHVGQNEYNSDRSAQAAALADFAERVPALQLPVARPVKLQLRTG
ncbi:MAG TPA: hypothetical protein VM326_01260, partial [Sphingomicrobium sp.]|nr:hypothetical protein [Sphingomicrobium sp.]